VSAAAPEPFVAALFLVAAMSIAGAVHVAWLRSAAARRLAWPLDGGLTVRGRRLFGANKRVRGFVVMPPAAAASFAALGALRDTAPAWVARGTWVLDVGQYALLGFACGLAFMLAELPNSFLKRQFDIAPGMTGDRPLPRAVFLILDRCDSVLGVLIAASLLVPMHAATWLWVLVLGPGVHAGFSVLLHRCGVKARAL
jgi:CDP-2,3-bis-(O-geranylgeranyl)-sn-glycerol synthase